MNNLDYEIEFTRKLAELPATYRLGEFQTEILSRCSPDQIEENGDILVESLHNFGLAFNFSPEVFSKEDYGTFITSKANIWDALSANREIVASGYGYSLIRKDLMHQGPTIEIWVKDTRKAALDSLFSQLFPPIKAEIADEEEYDDGVPF